MVDYADDLKATVTAAAASLAALPEDAASVRPSPGKWSPKEIIGHLIDSAANNHQRFVRAQLQDDLVFAGYAQDDWVATQNTRTRPGRFPDPLADVQSTHRLDHRNDAGRGAPSRASPSQFARARVATRACRDAYDPRLLYARLRSPFASPSAPDRPGMTSRRLFRAILLVTLPDRGLSSHAAPFGGIHRLAGFPRAVGVGRGGRPGAARRLERSRRRAHPMEGRHPGSRALEPDRLGRSRLRDERDQQPRRCDLQARPLRRRRRVRGSHRRSAGW